MTQQLCWLQKQNNQRQTHHEHDKTEQLRWPGQHNNKLWPQKQTLEKNCLNHSRDSALSAPHPRPALPYCSMSASAPLPSAAAAPAVDAGGDAAAAAAASAAAASSAPAAAAASASVPVRSSLLSLGMLLIFRMCGVCSTTCVSRPARHSATTHTHTLFAWVFPVEARFQHSTQHKHMPRGSRSSPIRSHRFQSQARKTHNNC